MPRSKEAISALKGFLRGEMKGRDEGEVAYAKGVMAALKWMTDPIAECPYEELVDDLGPAEGWVVLEDKPIAPKLVEPIPAPEHRPNVELWTPDKPLPSEADNPKALAPGSFEAIVKDRPWLGQVATDLAGMQEGTPLSDRNAVVVGAGLGDEPVLRGGGY